MTFWANNPGQVLSVNHDWSRSISELEAKVARNAGSNLTTQSSSTVVATALPHYLEWEKSLNAKEDLLIQQRWEHAKTLEP